MTRAPRQLLLVAALALVPTAAALADVADQPADSPAQAYGPLQPGVTVSGSFTRPDDVDYLSFKVDAPNTAVRFVVSNTSGSCGSPDGAIGCAVWGTLIDGQQQQLGGEGSSAGTGEVDAGGTDAIDWVIAQPGTYYLAMDSGGYLPAYKVRLAPPTALISNLSARSARHGKAMRVSLKAGRSLRSLTAKLTLKRGAGVLAVARRTLNSLPAGSSTFTLTINAAGRRALASAAGHRLRLRLRVTATPRAGAPATATRSVTLHR